MQADVEYLRLLRRILNDGSRKGNRTGTDTISLFSQSLRFDLIEGFPLLTTKKVNFRAIAVELLWLISGQTNIRPLLLDGVHIWDAWPFKHYLQSVGMWEELGRNQNSPAWKDSKARFCDRIIHDDEFAAKYGELGPVYGAQWRAWKGADGKTYDQLAMVIDLIKSDPLSRRMIVNSWNVADIPEMVVSGLPPCHYSYQFYVNNGALSCDVVMRSADVFLGVPFNIASYALLTHLVAKVTKLVPRELNLHLVDAHLYVNHVNQAREQMSRPWRASPTIAINNAASIDDFGLESIDLQNYDPHPPIYGEVSI